MHQQTTLKNGLTLITLDLPYLDSVTSLVAVGAGSRYETKQNNGVSHFLEHMFFKGSKKYPTAEVIANLIDGIGAVNNAHTSKEYTAYFVKSAAKHLELSTDILAPMCKESLLDATEIEKEKGVIIEELRMIRDNPMRYVWDLYEMLQFGDQPLGWDIGGDEQTIQQMTREDFVSYTDSLYSPKNMSLVYAGKIPENITEIAEKYFADLPPRSLHQFSPFVSPTQTKPKVNIYHKATDQANIVLGTQSFDRNSHKRFAAKLLGSILGGGMSSRLFIEVREKRGLAYSVHAGPDHYLDTGTFVVYAGLKLDQIQEGLKVIKSELEKITSNLVTPEELAKAKEMERGHLALRSESTNFLADHFGVSFILDRKIESFADYLSKIEAVTAEDILSVAKEIFVPAKYNLQIIAPLKDTHPFVNLLLA